MTRPTHDDRADKRADKPADRDADRPSNDNDFDREFQREFERLSLDLAALDARKRQVDRDRQTRDRLRAELKSAKSKANPDRPNGHLAELRDRLELLDLNLESSLFSWTSLREPFWFGLRYGGLGFVLGWLLHACTQ